LDLGIGSIGHVVISLKNMMICHIYQKVLFWQEAEFFEFSIGAC
jgi:hypothetical protein